MQKQITTIWQFPRVSPAKQREGFYCLESISHPAKMPTHLAQAILLTYTRKGDLVLDPMTGIGTTVIEAVKLGRNAIGIEYEKRFVKICNKNLVLTKRAMGNDLGKGKFIQGDARELHKTFPGRCFFDAIIFSPPFANTLAGSAKDDTKKFKHGSAGKFYGSAGDDYQIGNLKHTPLDITLSQTNISTGTGKNYLSEMFKVYQQCHRLLKPGSFMILLLKNFRRKGEEINLAGETMQLCRLAGFKFFQTCIHVLNGASFWQITHARNTPHLMLSLTEYILIFKKD